MNRRAGLLLLCLAAAALAKDDDPFNARFKEFRRKEIDPHWQNETMDEVRVIMIRGFEPHDAPDAARWLMTVALKDPSANVIREAVRVLSVYKRPPTIAHMAEVWSRKLKKNWEARAFALLALARRKGDVALGTLRLGLQDKDPRVVAAACRAAGMGRHIALRPELEALLKHKHRAARGGALLALGELGGDESLPAVFKVFCTDKSHRVRYDAWVALKKLSLEERPCDPGAWRDWWEQLAGTWSGEEGEKNPWGTTYPRYPPNIALPGDFFGIPVLGERVCFVLDVSLDMDNPWMIDVKAERKKKPEERIPNFFSVKTRWDLTRNYVNRCLKQLPKDTEVAFVFFSQRLWTWPETGKFVKNSKKTRAGIAKYMEDKERSGSTAMYEGLAAAWGFLREGHPKYNFDRGCDTIVFLTDGLPRAGKFENKSEQLADEVWRVAVPRNLRVHAVGLYNHDYALCAAMAGDSTGLYVHAQDKDDTAEPQDLDFWPAKKKAFEEARKKAKRGQ